MSKNYLSYRTPMTEDDKIKVFEASVIAVKRDNLLWNKRKKPNGEYEKTFAREILESNGMSLKDVLNYQLK